MQKPHVAATISFSEYLGRCNFFLVLGHWRKVLCDALAWGGFERGRVIFSHLKNHLELKK